MLDLSRVWSHRSCWKSREDDSCFGVNGWLEVLAKTFLKESATPSGTSDHFSSQKSEISMAYRCCLILSQPSDGRLVGLSQYWHQDFCFFPRDLRLESHRAFVASTVESIFARGGQWGCIVPVSTAEGPMLPGGVECRDAAGTVFRGDLCHDNCWSWSTWKDFFCKSGMCYAISWTNWCEDSRRGLPTLGIWLTWWKLPGVFRCFPALFHRFSSLQNLLSRNFGTLQSSSDSQDLAVCSSMQMILLRIYIQCHATLVINLVYVCIRYGTKEHGPHQDIWIFHNVHVTHNGTLFQVERKRCLLRLLFVCRGPTLQTNTQTFMLVNDYPVIFPCQLSTYWIDRNSTSEGHCGKVMRCNWHRSGLRLDLLW